MKHNILRHNRIIAITVIAAMICTMFCGFAAIPVYAATEVMVGQASSGETGSYNQTAGDQTGKEVYVSAWNHNSTTRHWSLVARPKDSAVAKKIAQTVYDACENPHVGYDRADDDIKTFYLALKGCGWDAGKITTDCETTCTPMIAAAINSAGICCGSVVSAAKFVTLFKTGALSKYFAVYTSNAYTSSSSKLMAGDILITYYKTGGKTYSHGAVVVSSPNSKATNASDSSGTVISGVSNIGCVVGQKYKINAELNVRYGPGTNYGIMQRTELTADGKKNAVDGTNAVLKSGTTVSCIAVSGDWLQIPSGWICGRSNGTLYVTGIPTPVNAISIAPAAPAPVSAVSTVPAVTASKPKTTSTTVKVKVGKNYKLKKKLYVRKGPGTKYGIKKRSSLSSKAKKCAVKGTKKAKFKKGTVVTCLQKKGNWMRVPSGWVCCKKGNVANA